MKNIFTYIYCLIFCVTAFAQQESIVPLNHHPKLNDRTNQDFIQKKATHRITSISLPFFDDFYQTEIYPNVALWQDNFVYINTTIPRETVTIGVASFDGTDSKGIPYSNGAKVHGAADKLTSNPIDLTGLTADSNVYLSFYYLQGEYGETPLPPNDQLIVQFLDTTGSWNAVWQTTAATTASLNQVFIKVDSIYLNGNFQFRFQSYGNLNGANDIWNVDYVKLDKNRDTAAERNIKEMAYEFLPSSLLKNYYVMPYHQFDTTDLADTVSIFVKNNFINTTTDIVDYYEATVVNTGSTIATFNGPSRDFSPLTENKIDYPKFSIPTNLTNDTVIIQVDYHFDVSAEAGENAAVLANNAMTHKQVFSNFFAYDDGSAERGYFVGDLRTNQGVDNYKMAVKYNFNRPDTLQAIKLQFYPVLPDNNLATFSICVWKNFRRNSIYTDNDLIYRQSNLKIANLNSEFGVDTINGYYYAPIKPDFLLNGATFPLVLSDTFAIGLIVNNKLSLTVGFDRNNNRSQNNFYVDGTSTKWLESTIPGTMIINPVVGKPLPDYLTPVKDIIANKYDVKIFPNPTRDLLYIHGIKDNNLLQIFSLDGSLIKQIALNNPGYIDVNELAVGMYLLKITNTKTAQYGISKFIKSE